MCERKTVRNNRREYAQYGLVKKPVLDAWQVNTGRTESFSLKDMVQTLEGVTEEAWGRYAFAREPLERKFTSQEKDAYTEIPSDRTSVKNMGLKIRRFWPGKWA